MTDSKQPPKGDSKKFQKTIARLKEQEFVKKVQNAKNSKDK